ncbi:hypothetical protein GYH30_004839 [Glycine max]|uniref:Uncharacterized protein n=1 Tax=Glycine max TaxID=3847 RepID=A0A0R0KZJ7_SOYBN|nr:hypothetical protein JHK87_004885 [Glycine soja]KAG5080992.1 hypothetical protein JHK86_005057 [Glycine max]KAH1061551.1 hypothetical protein GYH30_004839 [Glycine max]
MRENASYEECGEVDLGIFSKQREITCSKGNRFGFTRPASPSGPVLKGKCSGMLRSYQSKYQRYRQSSVQMATKT